MFGQAWLAFGLRLVSRMTSSQVAPRTKGEVDTRKEDFTTYRRDFGAAVAGSGYEISCLVEPSSFCVVSPPAMLGLGVVRWGGFQLASVWSCRRRSPQTRSTGHSRSHCHLVPAPAFFRAMPWSTSRMASSCVPWRPFSFEMLAFHQRMRPLWSKIELWDERG